MKPKFSIFVLTFFIVYAQNFAQIEVLTCGLDPNIEQSSIMAAIGGKYKPSSNAPGEYFRALYVFAQFASDTKEIPNWSKNSLPTWAYDFVDQAVADDYSQFTVSEYFDLMSEDDFDFMGDIHPNIITVQENKTWGDANIDVINQLNNQIGDFSRYDNWYYLDGAFHFSVSNGDGYVDMIHIIYRWADISWFSNNEGWGGNAYLGFSGDIALHDGIKINGSALNVLGSGITTNNKASVQSGWSIAGHIAHEFGHYLFGGDHPRESGVMANGTGGGTFAMSAIERETLGYITIEPLYNGQTKTIGDYLTTGDALKVSISSTEYFVIENHRRLNHHDQIIRGGAIQGALDPNTTIGQGMYVWYVRGSTYPWTINALTADGSWKWKFDRWETMTGWGGGGPDPVVAVLDRNGTYKYLPSGIYYQTGNCDRNPDLYVNINGSYQHWPRWHDIDPLTNQWWISRDCMGDETDAFKVGYNDQITPWSNPSTTKLINGNENFTNITIKLLSEDEQNNQITVKAYTTQSGGLLLPPSKPQNLISSVTADYHPKLTWDKNLEPDMTQYKVYRSYSPTTNFTQIGTATHNPFLQTITYIDYTIDVPHNWHQGGSTVYYRVTAVDNQSLESVKSDYVQAASDEYIEWKPSNNNINNKNASAFSLSQNYPNPFNPSTVISYSIPFEGSVRIRVFNMLGEMVSELVNQTQSAGEYETTFDAGNLASGMYFYSIEAISSDGSQNLKEVKKMLLQK